MTCTEGAADVAQQEAADPYREKGLQMAAIAICGEKQNRQLQLHSRALSVLLLGRIIIISLQNSAGFAYVARVLLTLMATTTGL